LAVVSETATLAAFERLADGVEDCRSSPAAAPKPGALAAERATRPGQRHVLVDLCAVVREILQDEDVALELVLYRTGLLPSARPFPDTTRPAFNNFGLASRMRISVKVIGHSGRR
jgi:hypothetical protein